MKKIFNYTIFKISSKKIASVFIIVFIYQFGLFLTLLKQNIQFNFYDLIMNSFNYLSLFYSISLFYIISIYNICEKTNFYKYIFLKFKSKYQVYNINVLIIFVLSVLIVLFINLICIIECLGNISFDNIWSPYFFNMMSGKVINVFHTNEALEIITNKLTPLNYIMFNNIFVILYLFFLGMIFLVSNLLFKKRAISFILVIIVNISSICLDSVQKISKLTFTYNIYLFNSPNNELYNNSFIIYKLIYWILLIIIMFFIGRLLTKKIDYYFEGE